MELTTLLERMKMEHLLAQLDGVCEHAAKGDLDYKGFLTQVLEAEWRGRHQRGVESRLKLARLPWVKTLDQFDFDFQPSVDRKQVRELSPRRAMASTPSSIGSFASMGCPARFARITACPSLPPASTGSPSSTSGGCGWASSTSASCQPHPEQNGADERMHRTLKGEVCRPPRARLVPQQRAFNTSGWPRGGRRRDLVHSLWPRPARTC